MPVARLCCGDERPSRPLLRWSRPTWLSGWFIRRSLSSARSSNCGSLSCDSVRLSITARPNAPRGRAIRSQGWSGKAAHVLARTIGLRTGAANRNPRAVPSGAPLASILRATGTLPHSQAGSANPINAPVMGASKGWSGNRLIQAVCGTNQRARPAITTPSSRKGIASNSSP